METLKKVLILLSSLGFLLVVIGLITPGWVLLDFDVIEMDALQLKKMPVQFQQQYNVSNMNKYIFDVQYNDRFNTATFLCP
jgi:hypothetical protein